MNEAASLNRWGVGIVTLLQGKAVENPCWETLPGEMHMAFKHATSDQPNSQDAARYRANYLSEQEGSICIASSPKPSAIHTWPNSTGDLPV